jgi:threonine dehydrogenase-like Zn-dependent dehydrogenase
VSDEASGRAVEFPGPERVETVPIEEPVPGPDEVVVSASVSAVSAGSELLAYRGELDPETVADEELSALDADPDVADRLVTDRVPIADAPTAYRRLADGIEPTLQLLFTSPCTN